MLGATGARSGVGTPFPAGATVGSANTTLMCQEGRCLLPTAMEEPWLQDVGRNLTPKEQKHVPFHVKLRIATSLQSSQEQSTHLCPGPGHRSSEPGTPVRETVWAGLVPGHR